MTPKTTAEIQSLLDEQKRIKEELKIREDDAHINRSLAAKERFNDPDYVESHRLSRERLKDNPDYLKAVGDAARKRTAENTEWRENVRKGSRANAQDPEYKKRYAEGRQKMLARPGYHEAHQLGREKMKANEEWRANVKASNQKKAQNPETKARVKAGLQKAKTKFWIDGQTVHDWLWDHREEIVKIIRWGAHEGRAHNGISDAKSLLEEKCLGVNKSGTIIQAFVRKYVAEYGVPPK